MKGPFSLLDGHEQVVFGSDPESGLRCIIAIHSTALGPALGGTRFHAYASEEDALVDVLRLSRAMTMKAACAGLDLGGGKAVIIGDPSTEKTEPLLRAYGRMIASLGGRYVTACDVGTDTADMATIGRETRWVSGATVEEGGSGDSGIMTAFGTYVGIKACAERVWGGPDLGGRHIAVQGIGKVGRVLIEHLHAEGAKLTVADVDEHMTSWAAERVGADVVASEDIHAVDADIFSPNALGGVLNDSTLRQLQCRVVAGAANNQLLRPEHGAALADAGILFAPDYVINAGGLIQVGDELHPDGHSPERTRARTAAIGARLLEIFDLADAAKVSTSEAAEHVAQQRIADVGRLRGIWVTDSGQRRRAT
jgi:valine dehydrogenase (NAD+)